MKYEWKIAMRFLQKGRGQTVLILLGIAIGVAVQIFLSSLVTSLQAGLIEQTVGNAAQIQIKGNEYNLDEYVKEQKPKEGAVLRGNYIQREARLENWRMIEEIIDKDSRVKVSSPLVQGNGIVNNTGKSQSVMVKGILLGKADQIYQISPRLIAGNLSLEGNYVFVGNSLAATLGLEYGDSIKLFISEGVSIPLVVNGIFDLENEQINQNTIFIDLKRAQKLFGMGSGISMLEVQLFDPFLSDLVTEDWRILPGNLVLEEWKEQNKQLLIALSSQSSSSYTIQFFVILAVTLGISSVLAISAVQKSKEIGILKAMGATKKSVGQIFLFQGLILGIIGSMLGLGIGIFLIDFFGYMNQANQALSVEIKWGSAWMICLLSTICGMLASLIPARKAANLNPMEAIKIG